MAYNDRLRSWLTCTSWFGVLLLILLPASSLAAAHVYKVGVFDNKPIVFQSQPGQYAGISIDVLKSIEAKEDVKFKYVYAPWKTLLTRLKAGQLDLLVGIAYSSERAKLFDFTDETLINNWGVVYRNPASSFTSLEDLRNKRVALMSGSIHSRVFTRLMKDFQFKFEAVNVPSYIGGLQAVEQGKADAAVINRVISLLNASNYDVIETGIIFNPVEVRMATPKGMHPRLIAMIDRYLTEQKRDPESAYHQSLNKWLVSSSKDEMPIWLGYAIGLFILVLLVLMLSNILIRRQVAVRTAELSESELRFRQLAETISEVFWIGSPDWRRVHYVSPMFEKVWGIERRRLYEDPAVWLESVHAEDRQILVEDITRKSNGDFSSVEMPLYRLVSSDGSLRWILARAYPIRDERGEISRIAGIAEDITVRKESEDKINFMAMHDALTKLDNRYAFEKNLLDLMSQKTAPASKHALLYIDLDQFKIVNDTCGHAAGDKMLRMLAATLQEAVTPYGTIARLGGDEFGVILRDTTLDQAKKISQILLDTIKAFRFIWLDNKFTVGASIGLVMMEDDEFSKFDLLSAADMACYAAKENGRNRVHVFTHNDAELVQRHGEMQWVSRLNQALEENRFVLHRQSIRRLQTSDRHDVCHEYLLRLYDENNQLIFPDAFIPAAERYEMMPRIDRWVLSHVFEYLRINEAALLENNSHPVAFINLSGQIFTDDLFHDFVIDETKRSHLNPANICFEITETAAVGNLLKATQFISKLREHGFRFALDDFGTGMSSFSYLKSLPVDYVKIDGIFIKDLLKDPMNSSIVEAVTHIGHNANLQIVAEWIEGDEVLEALTKIGVDYGQGYAIDKPGALPNQVKLSLVKGH